MILIADSGSTKTDWLLSDKKELTIEIETIGFNPFFHTTEYVLAHLNKSKPLLQHASQITEIKFYGSGCSSEERKQVIADAFKQFFPNAHILVDHDMLGAALASCFDNPGLVAILGTGSNIAFWDGKNLRPTNHGLGYVLGDEGSGSYFGRKLITHFLYGVMPDDLKNKFYQVYRMDKETAIEHVYHKPNANVYLASFSRFLSQNDSHPYIQNLLHSGLTEFAETSILVYPEHTLYPVHFIGSIAFHFKSILTGISVEKNFKVGKIMVRPVEELLRYFINKN
jgi:N-acetylglucosamine kinase-like BadF-type ATPase